MASPLPIPSREQLLHTLYEAAELEHDLMCTYLYAAFSLRRGPEEGLTAEEAAAVSGWRQRLLQVAIEEMGHLAAVWNITSALGGTPRFGRENFPLNPGSLPAGVVVKLAPFCEATLQHFIYLERPADSLEPDGTGFEPEFRFLRGSNSPRVTPMGLNYETVGGFYSLLGGHLRNFVQRMGESAAFCGDPALQLSRAELSLAGCEPVVCLKTALAAFNTIVEQGEGAPADAAGSHYNRFLSIRAELAQRKSLAPAFSPAFPAAFNPVQRTPMRDTGRVWIEEEEAASTVDVANAAYGVMMRLLAYSFVLPRPARQKAAVIDLALGLMHAVGTLGEHAARLPAGPSNPGCNAGMSFITLRDSAPLAQGPAAHRALVERLTEVAQAAAALNTSAYPQVALAARQLASVASRARQELEVGTAGSKPAAPAAAAPELPRAHAQGSMDVVSGKQVSILYEDARCIHARVCVTRGPRAFLANVPGRWIYPDAMDVTGLVEIAHDCPSGAIGYRRHDGQPDEEPPPVNLLVVREAGPYAVRGELHIDGEASGFRATLCRCGASSHKPYCDNSHRQIGFGASGEPASTETRMLEVRDGVLAVDPQADGPLQLRGNLEITTGTGRVVARVTQTQLCRCGGSQNKPFCDGTHQRIGFRSG